MKLIERFKIPTLLGLTIIVAGISAGVFLVAKDQVFFASAIPNLAPQNITLSNITDSAVTISWQTAQPTISFVSFTVKGSPPQTALDDADNLKPQTHTLHYTTIKNLQPETQYSFKIVSGKSSTGEQSFKTARSALSQNGFGPIRGTVFDGTTPLENGVAYLSIAGAVVQSSKVTSLGNFIIPISLMRKDDLSDIFQISASEEAKLTIISDQGTATALIKIKPEGQELPPILLGQNVDLTTTPAASPKPSSEQLNKFDLNGDGQINALDYSILLQNFGKNPKNRKADLNNDGVVDTKDLGIMAKEIENLAGQKPVHN